MRLKNKDIAEMLGISVTAVSLAINGRPGVSDETRRKVLELVSESNRQALGEATARATARSIVLVVHKATGDVINDNPFFSNLVETVQQEAQWRGFTLTCCYFLPGQDLQDHLAYIKKIGADGMILEATELDEQTLWQYLALDMPCVLLDGYFDLVPIDAVTLDDQTAMLRAYNYAYSKGHRDIGFLAGVPRINNFIHHRDGFYKGIASISSHEGNHPEIELPCQIERAYSAMKSFLEDPPEAFSMPTCFLADLDNIAAGAMRAIEEAGYRIPEDVSIIGYGNTTVASLCHPALTSTQINLYDSGRLAVQRLADKLDHPERDAAITTFVSSKLVERDSVTDLQQ